MGVKGTPNAKNGKSREIFGQGDNIHYHPDQKSHGICHF